MTIHETGSLFAWQYGVTAFVATLGVIQIAVASSGLRGLCVLPYRRTALVLGVVLFVGALLWFFLAPLWTDGPWKAGTVAADSSLREWGRASWGDLSAARNVNDIDGGLSATAQGLWFPLGAIAAIATTVILGTLANLRMRGTKGDPSEGLEALRTDTYPRALSRSLTHWRPVWLDEVRARFRKGAHPGGIRDWRMPRFRGGPSGATGEGTEQ